MPQVRTINHAHNSLSGVTQWPSAKKHTAKVGIDMTTVYSTERIVAATPHSRINRPACGIRAILLVSAPSSITKRPGARVLPLSSYCGRSKRETSFPSYHDVLRLEVAAGVCGRRRPRLRSCALAGPRRG